MRVPWRWLLPLVMLAASAVVLVACGSGDSQGGSPGPERVSVTIKGDSVTPHAKPIEASVGQPIVLDVTSDRAAELHVHSSPEHEFEVAPGHNSYRFTLEQPGVVDVEEHQTEDLVLRITVK